MEFTKKMKTTIAIDRKLLFTKNDKEDPRIGELIRLIEPAEIPACAINPENPDLNTFFVLGYPDHEGIELNGGRIGAAEAPDSIRTYLYKMTPHLGNDKQVALCDVGNINNALSLTDRHEHGRKIITEFCRTSQRWISFGGGHDYGYCDSTAFAEVYQQDAIVINFDAHLDVRPTDKGLNSGTPFYRLLNEFSRTVQFLEVGIQNQCNSKTHLEWAKNKGAEIITLDQINAKGLAESLKETLVLSTRKKVFLSVDIDAFTSNEAPGCSQSWTTGIKIDAFLQALHWLCSNFEVKGLAIYEVSPRLDQDNRTSKLAALIAHNFIFHSKG